MNRLIPCVAGVEGAAYGFLAKLDGAEYSTIIGSNAFVLPPKPTRSESEYPVFVPSFPRVALKLRSFMARRKISGGTDY